MNATTPRPQRLEGLAKPAIIHLGGGSFLGCALAVALSVATGLATAPAQAQEAPSRWLDSSGRSAVSAVKAKRWVEPETQGKMVERGNGVYVQVQKAEDQKDRHCVMDVPAVRENRYTGKKVYRVNKAVNICE